MSQFPKFLLLILVSIFTLSCGDDCTKTITHPGYTLYAPGGTTYYPPQTQEIPCNEPGPIGGELGLNVSYLQNMSVEVVQFNFIPDTGNNTSRLQFEIKIHNNENTRAQGVPLLTLLVDGVESTGNFSSQAFNSCKVIEANSSCIFTYGKESSLDYGIVENIYLVDVKYALSR